MKLKCTMPITGYQPEPGARLVFEPPGRKVLIPCGGCIKCRIHKSLQWKTRGIHEMQMHDSACFLTLTYDEENLPEDRNLVPKHVRDFMKRLRYYYSDKKISWFGCGEYGETRARPHYHLIIYGIGVHDFEDRQSYRGGKNQLWSSEKLSEIIWKKGFATIGNATPTTIEYCCSYMLKEQNQYLQTKEYDYIDQDTGEIFERMKPMLFYPRKPALGLTWLKKYWRDLRKGYITLEGKKIPPPAFYIRKLQEIDPELSEELAEKARKYATENINTYEDNPSASLQAERNHWRENAFFKPTERKMKL